MKENLESSEFLYKQHSRKLILGKTFIERSKIERQKRKTCMIIKGRNRKREWKRKVLWGSFKLAIIL